MAFKVEELLDKRGFIVRCTLINGEIDISYAERLQKDGQLIFVLTTPSNIIVHKFKKGKYLSKERVDEIYSMMEFSCYELIHNEAITLFTESYLRDLDNLNECFNNIDRRNQFFGYDRISDSELKYKIEKTKNLINQLQYI